MGIMIVLHRVVVKNTSVDICKAPRTVPGM